MTDTTFRVEFDHDRIGRRHDVAPITVTVTEGHETAYAVSELVRRYARTFLVSQAVEVAVELGPRVGSGGTGMIFAGIQEGGRFTLTPVPAVTP